MLNNNCHKDCNSDHTCHQNYNSHNCPFVQDSNNPNRYVCLKCGTERQLNNRYPNTGTLLLILLFSLIVVPMVNTNEDINESKPQKEQTLINYSQ